MRNGQSGRSPKGPGARSSRYECSADLSVAKVQAIAPHSGSISSVKKNAGKRTMVNAIQNNVTLCRYELDVDGVTAFVTYERSPGIVTLVHTEVPPRLSGRGVGSALARGVLESVRADGLKVSPRCPFMAGFIEKHREFRDLVKDP
jgi:predicted GNAT family acetyltransferase